MRTDRDALVLSVAVLKDQQLNDWEKKFVGSLDLQLLRGIGLSPKQHYFLQKIEQKFAQPSAFDPEPRAFHPPKKTIKPMKSEGAMGMFTPPARTEFYNDDTPPWE